MNSHPESDKRIRVDVRVRGTSDAGERHEWTYMQMWATDEVAVLLEAKTRKSQQDSESPVEVLAKGE